MSDPRETIREALEESLRQIQSGEATKKIATALEDLAELEKGQGPSVSEIKAEVTRIESREIQYDPGFMQGLASLMVWIDDGWPRRWSFPAELEKAQPADDEPVDHLKDAAGAAAILWMASTEEERKAAVQLIDPPPCLDPVRIFLLAAASRWLEAGETNEPETGTLAG